MVQQPAGVVKLACFVVALCGCDSLDAPADPSRGDAPTADGTADGGDLDAVPGDPEGQTVGGDPRPSVEASDVPGDDEAAPDPRPAADPGSPCPEPGPLPSAPGLPDFCNGRDDDCDGAIDEDTADVDGDGYSPCPTANALPRDCDPDRSDVHPDHEELCDGVDNDCDGSWDEAAEDCEAPALVCDVMRECPAGLECERFTNTCLVPVACPTVALADGVMCDPPEGAWWEASDCDATQCSRWQDGTCWADCTCAPDGRFRWDVGCTE